MNKLVFALSITMVTLASSAQAAGPWKNCIWAGKEYSMGSLKCFGPSLLLTCSGDYEGLWREVTTIAKDAPSSVTMDQAKAGAVCKDAKVPTE
jgi:hypothetical protein